ncbi:hypothetical protein CVS40_3298 [Lucilia cuprina]|nr:hypothetical protein CVS40_3298 [Lucilia cuprina]
MLFTVCVLKPIYQHLPNVLYAIVTRLCLLSELRKLVIQPKGSLPRPSGTKPRGAMARHYQTRSVSRNLGQDNSDSNPNAYCTDQPVRTPEASNVNVAIENSAQSNNNSANISNNGIDYSELSRLIEQNLTRLLTNMNIVPNTNPDLSQNPNRPASLNNSNIHLFDQPNINILNSPIRPNSAGNSYHSTLNADKIALIIQNWNVKFDGTSNGLNIEEFLYRIRTLTKDYFNSDFSIICRNLHILLTGKAREWYWRYHKRVQVIEWNDFCEAIRCQYREFKSSFDIREEIRNRKQKPGESFDSFFEAVYTIMDKLPTPMSDLELIEILARNLRPDIRQDLLYVPVHSIPHLRKLVQMRENFLSEEHVRRNMVPRLPNPKYPRRLAALSADEINESSQFPDEISTEISVDAVQNMEFNGKCWNCEEIGHHWQDYLKDRSVFCYGCGEKQVYKPNCTKCANKKQAFSKNLKLPFHTEGK